MQNKYVGDVADFGKRGLLRFLSGMTSEGDLARLRLILSSTSSTSPTGQGRQGYLQSRNSPTPQVDARSGKEPVRVLRARR